MKYDYLIVGAGLAGSVIAERIATQLNKSVLVVDSRSHIGGNCYDYYDDYGVLVHKYGPHIFHTTLKKLWDYMSKFTEWHPYFHRVLAVVEGKKVPVPFNINSIEMLFPASMAVRIIDKLIGRYGFGKKVPILSLKETDDDDLKMLADYVYRHVFEGYTMKQWGLGPEQIDKSVTSRVPVYISRDDRYFQDKYQGIPLMGYTTMFKKMLKHKNIQIILNSEYKDIVNEIEFDKLVYTGPIDQYFDYKHGRLPYRSLNFDFRSIDKSYFQEVSQVNYPNNYDFTRITEFKHFLDQSTEKTTVAFEYPEEFSEGVNDPYYPVPNPETAKMYNKYKAEADSLEKVFFTGRLGEYKYYNMDQIVGVALNLFEKKLKVSE